MVHIQKIYGTSRTVSCQLRVPGKTYHLVLGRGGGYEGVALYEKVPNSSIRQRGRLIEYMRKNVSSSQLKGVFLDEKDRILTLEYYKGGDHSFSLFYNGRKTYMVHSYHYIDGEKGHFTSWGGGKPWGDFKEHLSVFNEVGRREIARKEGELGALFPCEKIWKEEGTQFERDEKKYIKKRSKKIERKIEFILADLKRVQNWKNLQDWALSQSEETGIFDGKKKVFGIPLSFGYGKNFFQKRDIVFQKIKNLKKAEVFLSERLERVRKQEDFSGDYKSEKKHFYMEWGREKTKKPKEGEEKTYDNTLRHMHEGVQYLQGVNAQGNDEIRKHSSKNSWWFHDGKGVSSHVIAISESLSDKIIAFAAHLILSQERKKRSDLQEIDLVYTQVKHLKSVKGQAGKVLYKKEKRRRFYLDELNKMIDDKS